MDRLARFNILGKPALILIDLQRMYCDPKMFGNQQTDELCRTIEDEIQPYRKAGIPIIWVYMDLDGTGLSDDQDFHHVRPQQNDYVVSKPSFSCFSSQDFRNLISNLHVTHPLLGGVSIKKCVAGTAFEACDKDLCTRILLDLVNHSVSTEAQEIMRAADPEFMFRPDGQNAICYDTSERYVRRMSLVS